MPSNKNSHTFAVSEAAAAVGASVHSLRRWCEWHAPHLSSGANPTSGQARRLDRRDIEVLRYVKAQRDEGLQTLAINKQLKGLTFAVIDKPSTGEQQIDEPAALEGLGDAPSDIVVSSAINAIETLNRRVEALETIRQTPAPVVAQRDATVAFGLGFVAALLFVLLIVGLAVLYGGFR